MIVRVVADFCGRLEVRESLAGANAARGGGGAPGRVATAILLESEHVGR